MSAQEQENNYLIATHTHIFVSTRSLLLIVVVVCRQRLLLTAVSLSLLDMLTLLCLKNVETEIQLTLTSTVLSRSCCLLNKYINSYVICVHVNQSVNLATINSLRLQTLTFNFCRT